MSDRDYYAETRLQMKAGYEAACALHRTRPSDDTTRLLLAFGFMHGIILAQQAELDALRKVAP